MKDNFSMDQCGGRFQDYSNILHLLCILFHIIITSVHTQIIKWILVWDLVRTRTYHPWRKPPEPQILVLAATWIPSHLLIMRRQIYSTWSANWRHKQEIQQKTPIFSPSRGFLQDVCVPPQRPWFCLVTLSWSPLKAQGDENSLWYFNILSAVALTLFTPL